jgi:hypothetical protein
MPITLCDVEVLFSGNRRRIATGFGIIRFASAWEEPSHARGKPPGIEHSA